MEGVHCIKIESSGGEIESYFKFGGFSQNE
jgi:hypothetical protein